MPSPLRTRYIWSQALQDASDQLPANLGRSSLVHGLIQALSLLESNHPDDPSASEDSWRAVVVPPDMTLGTEACLRRYHDAAYVDFLLNPTLEDERSDSDTASDDSLRCTDGSGRRPKTTTHGLQYDCPPFPALPAYASLVAASTQTACRLLARDEADQTIHWDGGRHHALRNRASGFCYVADIVLGIMLLSKEGRARSSSGDLSPGAAGQTRTRRPRVMYLDLDLHYGDGVAQAFLSPTHYPHPLPPGRAPPRPPQVLTLSLHHASPIFFPPPTPHSGLPPCTTPHPFTLSLPLAAYPSAATYARVWTSCVERIHDAYDPDYVVLQLGVDGLPGDPIGRYGAWGLEGEGGVKWCVERVKAWGKPLCVLGGGGYDHPNTARAWAAATSMLVGQPLAVDTAVPDHPGFPEFAPSFTLEVAGSNVADENTDALLSEIEATYAILAQRIRTIVSAHS